MTDNDGPRLSMGTYSPIELLARAIEHEQEIAVEAEALRANHPAQDGRIDRELFTRLWPLLVRPIPAAYIQQTPAVKGKPYESTGIKSVQVQIDRMNNVLTPIWWWDVVHYEQDGKLCTVTICVGNRDTAAQVLVSRTSAGGVNQGSTIGNIYKGSYTNAAKRAFAMLGPGREVYVGMTDLDPDVNLEVAGTQAGSEPTTIGKEIAGKIVDRVWQIPGLSDKLQLAASHAAGRDVGDCGSKDRATNALAGLTYAQAERLEARLTQREEEFRQQATAEQPAAPANPGEVTQA